MATVAEVREVGEFLARLRELEEDHGLFLKHATTGAFVRDATGRDIAGVTFMGDGDAIVEVMA